MRRPWKDRLVRNCEEISEALLQRYEEETGRNPRVDEQGFCDWLGLKLTPTASKRIRCPIKK